MITKKVVESYVTSDGQEFPTELKALEYEHMEFLMYGVFGQLGNSNAGKTRHKASMLVLENLPAIAKHFADAGYFKVADTISEVAANNETAEIMKAAIEVVPVKDVAEKVVEILDAFKDEPGDRLHVKPKKVYKKSTPLPFAKNDVFEVLSDIKANGISYREDIVKVLQERNMVVKIDAEDGEQTKFKLMAGGHGYMSVNKNRLDKTA